MFILADKELTQLGTSINIDVVDYLTGDVKGAKEIQLNLPETGVYSMNLASSCCGSPVLARLEIKNNSCY